MSDPTDFDDFAEDSHDSKSLMANPEMSRRGFFSLAAAVGALTFLGSVLSPRGSIVSAWADEADKIHFSIYILGRDEMPILCFDMADKAKTPVEGMKVTITSSYKSGTLTATTNAEGFATVHIKTLSQQASDDKASMFSLYGEVVAEKDGYRTFHVPETYLCAGVPCSVEGVHTNTLEIPTRKVGEDDLYLRTAALDSADVQYSDVECTVGPENTIEHTFDVEVVGPANKQIAVKVVLVAVDGTETTWGSTTLTNWHSATKSYSTYFKGTWLKDAAVDSMLKVKFGYFGQAAQVMSSPVTFVKGKTGVSDSFGDAKVSPGQNSNQTPDKCPIPSWIISANDTFNCAFPAIPIKIFSDFKGNFGISATMAQLTFLKRRNGENKLEESDKFKHIFGGLGAKKAWKNYEKEVAKSIDQLGNCFDNAVANKRTFGHSPLTSKIDSSFQLQLMGYFNWKANENGSGHYWTGDVAISPYLTVDMSWTKQCVAIIPFYFVVDFSGYVRAKLAFGLKFDDGFTNIRWGHTLGKAPLRAIVILHIEVGLTLAVGVAGIAGIGLRGGGFFRLEFIFDEVQGKAFPHITLSIAAKAEALIQVFFLKKTYVLYQTPLTNVVDNWKTSKASTLSAGASQASLMSVATPETMDDAAVVTDDELAFAADYAGALVPVSDGASGTASDTEGELSLQSLDADADDEAAYVWEFTPIQKGATSGMSLMATDSTSTSTPGLVDPYDASGKTTYNPLRGLKPTFVNQLFKDSYSNSRLKVVHGYSSDATPLNGNEPTAVARLVTTNITTLDGKQHTVTRVAVSTWNHQKNCFNDEQIVDIPNTGINSEDRYDIDFDFDVTSTRSIGDVVYLAITSVARPSSETFENYEKAQFVSVIAWHTGQTAYYNRHTSASYTFHRLLAEGYSTSCPRIVLQSSLGNLNDQESSLVPYVYYYKTNNGSGATTLNMTATRFSWEQRLIDDLELIRDLPDNMSHESLRRGDFEVYAPWRTSTSTNVGKTDYQASTVIGWTGRNSFLPTPEDMEGEGAPYSFVRSIGIKYSNGKGSATIVDSLNLPNVASLTKRTVKTGAEVPFVYMEDASKADETAYKMVTLSDSLTMEVKDSAGKTGMNDYFASHDGKWLYTVRQVQQDVPGLSDDAQMAVDAGAKLYSEVYTDDDTYDDIGDVPTTGGEMEAYELLEARWHDKMDANKQGSYYDFYPIAQLDFCPDNIDIIENANGRRDFIMSTITAVDKEDSAVRYDLDDSYDMDEVYHVADIYHVAVPAARGLHVRDLQTTAPFAGAGENAYLLVELANMGNWFITGFDVEFYGPDDKLITTTAFTDLENRVIDTQDNYSRVLDSSGNPSYDADGMPVSKKEVSRFDTLGMLAPGSTRTYRIEFTIPQNLSGETDFSLRIKNPRCESSNVRKDYIESTDYLTSSSLVFVDPNMHGVPGSDSGDVKHTWDFESKDAPYAEEGKDPKPYARGDVNGNGQLNILDAQLAFDIANSGDDLEELDDYEDMKDRADVTDDDAVAAEDARAIQNAVHYGWE